MAATRTTSSTRSRLARFTRAYPALRGYALLPWLLPGVALFLGDIGVVQDGWFFLLLGISLPAAVLGHRAVGRWYDREFGLVRQRNDWNPRTFLYLGLFLAGLFLGPTLLRAFAGAPEGLFGFRGVLYWPWVWAGAALVGAAFVLRPHLNFLALYGAVVAALALLPLGELLGQPGDVHVFYGFFPSRIVRLLFFLAYVFSAHATLVRKLRNYRSAVGTPTGPTDLTEEPIPASHQNGDHP